MDKVVVFGGSGFLGSYVADELSQRGYSVIIADINESDYLTDNQTYICCNVLNPSDVESALGNCDFVYNLAGMSDIDQSINLPLKTFEKNVIGNINILEACSRAKLKRFVYASSAYANSDKGSFYGISKFTSEKVIEEYSRRSGLPFTVMRYGSVYGERADNRNGMYRLLRSAIGQGKIDHPGNGEEVREYIHAMDAARMSVDVIESEDYLNQHLILTGVERLRQRDLLQMIQEILNDQVEVTYNNTPWEGHYQVTPYSYHPSLAKKMIINPFIELGQGLVSCIRQIDESLSAEEPSSNP